MSKKMQVIIQKTHKNLGKKNEIIKVAQGYALNYLIPNKLAEIANEKKIKHLQMMKSIEVSKLANEEQKAIQLQQNLQDINTITINKKVGDKIQIFGSINEKDIISEISKISGITLYKKQIQLPDIKTLGIFTITIQLINNIYVYLRLQILPEEIKINI